MNPFPDTYSKISWSLLGCMWAGLVYHLSMLWGASADYSDRYIILVGSAFLVYQSRDAFLAAPVRPMKWARLPLLLPMIVLPVVWFLVPLLDLVAFIAWLLTGLIVVATFALALDTWGWPRSRFLLFPLLFVFLALPIPTAALHLVQGKLQGMATWSALNCLSWLGYNAVRNGFEIGLPGGPLEVVEACSGIRSLNALAAIAAFVAYYQRLGWLRGPALMAFVPIVVALCNGIRITCTGVIQEEFGRKYIEGTYHDMLGASMVLLGMVLILWAAHLLRRAPAVPAEPVATAVPTPGVAWSGLASLGIVLFGCGLSAAAFQQGTSRVKVDASLVKLQDIPLEIGEWKGVDLKIDPELNNALVCKHLLSRTYTNRIGQSINIWVMFWPATSQARPGGHRPEVCMPTHGYPSIKKEEKSLEIDGGGSIHFTEQTFGKEAKRMMMYYWTQDGPRFYTYEEAERQMTVGSLGWVLRHLKEGWESGKRDPRLGVLIGTPSGSEEFTRRALESFTKPFAAELYKTCPFGKPVP